SAPSSCSPSSTCSVAVACAETRYDTDVTKARLAGPSLFPPVRSGACDLDEYRGVVAGPFPAARVAVDAGGGAARLQRVADQHQVDPQSPAALERGQPVIPPAVVAGLVVEQAEAVVQAEAEQRLQRLALRGRAQDLPAPALGVVHVAVV